MNNKSIWLSIAAVILSFVGGFILANGLNRAEMEKLRTEIAGLQKSTNAAQTNQEDLTLSDSEIKQKIAEAEQAPKDFEFQKKLGVSLYKYAAMKKDTAILIEAEKILNRANQLNSNDYEVIVALGNLNFDHGFFKNENESYEKARKYYDAALKQKPDDVEVMTEIGMTFLLQKPSDTKKAITEFQKTLSKDPKHEKALYFLTQAFLQDNNEAEAVKTLQILQSINPKAPTIEEIKSQIKEGNK
ncbi:MAG TPA: tetratricopeptide repeat protein [Pyrinomonadaceae bacterium]|nr:tetratricopeptide repeat protein [Pyrinomonadaceae bacterium]